LKPEEYYRDHGNVPKKQERGEPDMQLTPREWEMLNGSDGIAVQTAMEILVRVGDACGAERLIPVTSAHIVLAMYKSIFDAGVEVCEKFADMGGRFVIPTTLDPCGMDTEDPEGFKTPVDYQEKQKRVIEAYRKMGAIPVWTCTPYLNGSLPRFGEHVGWTESSAVAFINSVLGARTNRETAVIDVCIGLTGRTMDYGLHRDENRRGQVLVELQLGGRELRSEEYPILGYYLGKVLGSRIGVVDGMVGNPSIEQLKSLMAGAAASGSVALLHIVGITPEAPTREKAFGGNTPEETIIVDEKTLADTWEIISTKQESAIDFVAVGCPHYTITEIKEVARLLNGRKVNPGTEFWIYTTKLADTLARRMGYRQILEESGVRFALETCMLISPVETWGFKTIMTDSAKCAYYAPMQCKTDVIFGSMSDCVEAAVTGKATARGGNQA
jgi:predicted aconitase